MFKKIIKFLAWLGSDPTSVTNLNTKRHEGVNQKEIDKQNKKSPKIN